jgi:hypothetical protein
MVIDSSD